MAKKKKTRPVNGTPVIDGLAVAVMPKSLAIKKMLLTNRTNERMTDG